MSDVPFLQMIDVSKKFGEIIALNKVSVSLEKGEILGLVGDNGAGKSTLMKILSGVVRPTEGKILFDGKELKFNHPGESRDVGIEMIYQDLALADNMDVVENVFLGAELERSSFGKLTKVIDRKTMEMETKNTLDKLSIEIGSIHSKVEMLSGGQRQSIAIARVIRSNAKLIVMDEPTAALGVSEVEKLLNLIRELKKNNIAVIVVSHRLEDIFEVGDRIVVLRHGENVGNLKVSETNSSEIRKLMLGETSHASSLH